MAAKGSRENLIGKNPDAKLVESLSNEKQVTDKTPPTRSCSTPMRTTAEAENSILFYHGIAESEGAGGIAHLRGMAHGVGLPLKDPILSDVARPPGGVAESAGNVEEVISGWLRQSLPL